MSSLPVWRSPEVKGGVKTHLHLLQCPLEVKGNIHLMSVPMMLSWVFVPSLVMICQRAALKLVYFLFGYDMLKSCWEMGLLPVWQLCRQVWLAVTAKRFWLWKSCLTCLFSVGWRSYRASSMTIVQYLWPMDNFQHGGQILMFPWEKCISYMGWTDSITRHWH